MAFSPDGQTLYTSARYSSIAIRDGKSGAVRAMISGIERGMGKYFALSRDGKQLAVADSSTLSSIEMRDPTTGNKLFQLPGPTGGIEDLTILPNGAAMTASRDNCLRWWNIESGRELKDRNVDIPIFIRKWCVLTPDGGGLFGWKDNRILYVDLTNGKQSTIKENVKSPWNSVFGVSGHSIFIATDDNKMEQWDAKTGTVRSTFELPPNGSKSPFGSIEAMSHDEMLIATISQRWVESNNLGYWMGGQLSIYDAKTGKLRKRWHSSEERFECAEFSRDGRFLVVGVSVSLSNRKGEIDHETLPISPKSGLLLFDAQTGEPIRGYEPAVKAPFGHKVVRTIAISPNGQLIADVRDVNSIVIHELATGEVCRLFRGHHNVVTRMAFSADSRRLVSVSDDSTGLVWDVSYASLAKPSSADRENLWADLAKPEWVLAGPAMADFAINTDDFLATVRERLSAANQPDYVEAEVLKWIEQLDVIRFDIRRRAQAELSNVGRAIVPLLREKLGKLNGSKNASWKN